MLSNVNNVGTNFFINFILHINDREKVTKCSALVDHIDKSSLILFSVT